MKLVVSQPMFIPWAGLFEQIRLADVYVHYDDVQMPVGRSFMSRVQIKTGNGIQWLSASIDRRRSKQLIADTYLVEDADWRARHLNLLQQNYREADHFESMFRVAREIYARPETNLAAFNQHAIEYFAGLLDLATEFHVASTLAIEGGGTQRLIDICRHFGASEYITGHGARNYLDHEAFEQNGISVSYMDYALRPYEQLHGDFTPYVTILDALANVGESARSMLASGTVEWRKFLADDRA